MKMMTTITTKMDNDDADVDDDNDHGGGDLDDRMDDGGVDDGDGSTYIDS